MKKGKSDGTNKDFVYPNRFLKNNGLTLSFFVKFNSSCFVLNSSQNNGIYINMKNYLKAFLLIQSDSLTLTHGIYFNQEFNPATTNQLYQPFLAKNTYATAQSEIWLFYIVAVNGKENKLYITEQMIEYGFLFFVDTSVSLSDSELSISPQRNNVSTDNISLRELKLTWGYFPHMFKTRTYNIKEAHYLLFYFKFDYYYFNGFLRTYDSSMKDYTGLNEYNTYLEDSSLTNFGTISSSETKFLNCGINEYWYDVCTSNIF